MRTIQAISIYRHPKLILLCLVIYCATIANMAINSQSVTGATYLISLLIAFSLCCALPIGAITNCIFMTVPFTAVLKLPIEVFSFITLLQLAFIIKSFFVSYGISVQKVIGISFIAFLTQLFPIFSGTQTFSNVILLIFNLLTFYCAYRLTAKAKISVTQAYFSFSIGVLVAGVISQYFGIHVAEMQEYRFCGLWTDPNFWGMFCLIGIITCLLIGFERPLLFIVTIPVIIGLALQGFLTLSRTFIVVCGLMVIVISWSYLKRSIWGGFLIISVLCVGIFYALPFVTEIFSERAIQNDDITNGRFENTTMIFDFMFNHCFFSLFGFGYNNILNVMQANHFGHGATHNSYADLFVDFGILWNFVFLILLVRIRQQIKSIIKKLFTLPGLVFCIILFYMGTLSMLKYVLFFLFGGVFIGYTINKKSCKLSKLQ